MQDALTIGELAARSGVAPSALRYYERLGLISARRTTGNQRRYDPLLQSARRRAPAPSTHRPLPLCPMPRSCGCNPVSPALGRPHEGKAGIIAGGKADRP